MSFEPLDLSVLVGRSGELWVSARSRLGAVYAVPRRGGGWNVDALGEQSATLADAVRFALPADDETQRIGETVRDLLFGDADVLALFQRTRGAAAAEGRPLLVGVLGAPQVVSALPWELTLDPEGGRHEFLTLAPDAHVMRLARARTYPVRSGPIAPPLQLLLVLSSPIVSDAGDDSLTFDLYEERRSILDELAPLVNAGVLEVDVEDHPTLENLRARISARERGYHIVHYLGHALEYELILENRQGSARAVDAETFTSLLQACPELRLVTYTGCLTARLPHAPADEDDWHRTLSVADLSVRAAAPAVIGMQAVLPFRTERLFARFFYRSLASGRSLVEAIQIARSAIRSDEFVGPRLDWSVPALFTGGTDPGPLLAPAATAPAPIIRPRRAELKLGLEESEPAAFARPVALREAIDVLSGRRASRVLLVSGKPEVRTPFIARVLYDLDRDVDLVFYVTAEELVEQVGDGDALELLCGWVSELLTRLDGTLPVDADGPSARRWSRLVEELVGRPAVLAVDGFDTLEDDVRAVLADALGRLALRRTRARVVLGVATSELDVLGDRAARRVAPIVLRPLEWSEVWRWVRRNVPEVARHGAGEMQPVYEAGLQDDLELWTRLGEQVATGRGTETAAAVRQMAERLVAERAPVSAAPALPPLRAALTNPDVAGRVAEFAAWITAMATEHDVGGRVSGEESSGERSSIAELVPVPTPFGATGTSSDAPLLQWAQRALEHGAHVLLLDFGTTQPSASWDRAIHAVGAIGALLVGAGGNDPEADAMYPAWHRDVLAVGALGDDGLPAPYTTWNPERRKPEIFAPESLNWTTAADFAAGRRGTSYAALGVTAAALVVWSVDRTLGPAEVRDALLRGAQMRRVTRNGKRRRIRVLDVAGALAHVRAGLLLKALSHGPLDERALVASTGLATTIARPLIEDLVAKEKVRRTVTPSGVNYELIS